MAFCIDGLPCWMTFLLYSVPVFSERERADCGDGIVMLILGFSLQGHQRLYAYNIHSQFTFSPYSRVCNKHTRFAGRQSPVVSW